MDFLKRIPAKRWLMIGAAAAVILLIAVLLRPQGATHEITGENLLQDSGFTQAAAGSGAWYQDAYVSRSTYTAYDFVTEEDGSVTAHITNMQANDARFAQIVDVRPDSLYCLEGDIRASAAGGLGANLSVEGPYVFSECLYDQPEWTHVKLYGRTASDQYTVTVFARLGGYSGEATGEAWFRDVKLTEVDSVPDGYRAYDWYRESAPAYEEEEEESDYETNSLVVHVVLMALALGIYGAMIWYALRRADRSKPLETGSLWVFALFATGLFIRLLIAVTMHGYNVDVGDFTAWATDVAARGPGVFYRLDLEPAVRREMYICDYPPGYILVLGLIGLLGQWSDVGVTEFMIKIPPIVADMLMAWLIHRALLPVDKKGRHTGHTVFSLCVTALILFNPLMLLTGAGWGQSDSVMMLFLVMTLLFGMKKQWSFALPCYMLAVLMKPQALMFGPLGLVALWLHYREIRKEPALVRAMVRDFLIGFGVMLAAAAAVVMPFAGNYGIGWLFELYGKTMSYYGYATVNATNLYFLAGENWTGLADTAPRWFGLLAGAVMGLPAVWAWFRQRGNDERQGLVPLVTVACAVVCAAVGLLFPLTWEFWSTALMALVIALSLTLCVLAGNLRHLPLYGGLLMTGLFAMGGMMHERYLYPAIPLLLWAWRLEDDDRILLCAALATAGCFLNTGCVLSRNQRIGDSAGHLTILGIGHHSDMGFLEYLGAVLNVLAFGLTACLGFLHTRQETEPWRFKRAEAAPEARQAAGADGPKGESLGSRVVREELSDEPRPRRLDRKDLCLVLAITAAYAVLAFWHLGSTTSPQKGYEFQAQYEPNPAYTEDAGETETPESSAVPVEEPPEGEAGDVWDEEAFDWDAAEDWEDAYSGWDEESDDEEGPYILVTEAVTFDLGRELSDFRMLFMGGVHQYDCSFTVETSTDGETWSRAYNCKMDIGNLFQWYYVRSNRGTKGLSLNGRYVRVKADSSGLTLMEILFRDADGNVLEVAGAVSSMGHDVSALIDEQDTLTGEPGWYNSMYFDEIYHARTAYEHYIGLSPYETTHPPLGKVLMSWCVAIFGMTPFGWRFAGTLAGVLMLPGLYLMARLLFKKRRYAVLCCLMLALDTLHYAQTRLATIDSYVVLFIIWSYYFMFRWMLTDFFGKPLKRSIIPLALSGLMMGFAVASKWTGCYAGVGLAILFFLSVGRRWYAVRKAQKDTKNTGERAVTAREAGKTRLVITVLSCFAWFMAIPALIYYLSYIPYFAPIGGVSVRRIINAAEGMFSYHATPRLGMDHPYYSPWYEWPLAVAKPMYYAADSYEPAGYASSILAFGNIAVWWVGFAALIMTLVAFIRKQVRGMARGYLPGAPEALAPAGEYDRRPLMLLIAFAAQYLPWMLVPRGTYIYHYFPSVPFIILCTGLLFEYLGDAIAERAKARALKDGKSADDADAAARRADRLCIAGLVLYLLIVAGLFIAFFPYASGLTVPTGWLDAMNWFGNLYY